ncbi:hypothetical protein ABU614_17500 [Lysobacter firmicutimachus]|uniref:Uncharacterized protein n=1 Tax=Lysobacter firmicutimachus TaxID=1792846 RepID=A0AAU8MSJ9_9GAMM|nr:hypothetical protein [Lysobacter antibioticus]
MPPIDPQTALETALRETLELQHKCLGLYEQIEGLRGECLAYQLMAESLLETAAQGAAARSVATLQVLEAGHLATSGTLYRRGFARVRASFQSRLPRPVAMQGSGA